jgi:glyoxylate reductase
MLGRRISGKRLGIIGMGRIGQAVARRARAFGMQIHYHNRRRHGEDDRRRARGDLLGEPRPDAGPHGRVSVNCPHTPATFHLLSARRLKLMKPTAYIVNTARGE